MDADEHVLVTGDLTHHEGEMLLAIQHGLVHIGPELASSGGDPRLGDQSHELLVPAAVANEIGDGDDREVVLLGEPLQVRQAGHLRFVLGHDLAEDARRRQAGGPAEVDGRLGVAGPLEDAPGPVAQREDMAGPVQVVGTRGRVDEGADGRGTVGGRDPGRGPVPEVDAHGERGPLRLGVRRHHEGQVQRIGTLGQQRHTDDPGRMGQEEGDVLRRRRLGGHDQVTLVLPVLVVHDDHHAEPPDGVNGLLDL